MPASKEDAVAIRQQRRVVPKEETSQQSWKREKGDPQVPQIIPEKFQPIAVNHAFNHTTHNL